MNHHAAPMIRDRSSIRIGPFAFHIDREELWRDGQPVRLPPQPARMLALLARRRGQIVSHDEARRAIWGDAVVEFDQGLHTIVKQLRAALGDDARHPIYVQTIPRRGYRLVAAPAPGASLKTEPATIERATAPRRRGPLAAAASFILLVVAFVVLSRLSGGAHANVPERLAIEETALAPFLAGLKQLENGDAAGAFDSLELALRADPGSAPILSARARARLRLAPTDPSMIELARQDAERANRIDPQLIEPRMLLARLALTRDRDPLTARRWIASVVRDAPREIEARLALSLCFSALGEHQRAIDQTERAMAIDPLGTQTLVDSGWVYFYARRFEDALAFADRALALEPMNEHGLGLRYESLEQLERWREAGEVLITLMDLADVPLEHRQSFDASNPRAFVAQAMKLHLARHIERGSSPVILAIDCIRLGDRDGAFAYLDQVLELELCMFAPFIGVDPRLDSLRDDPRFGALLKAPREPASARRDRRADS